MRQPADTVLVAVDGPVAVVSLNRGEVRNAFNSGVIARLLEVFLEVGARADVRVIVLRGNGPTFCAGADATWMRAAAAFSRSDNIDDALRLSTMLSAIDEVPQPVVARVHGAALGGGMGLLAAADVVVAAEDTVFGFTETHLGIIPAVISPYVLPKIGESWARALFPTGQRFGADLAARIGLVHHISSSGDLDETVSRITADILKGAPGAVRAAKQLVREMRGSANRHEVAAERIADLRTAPEGQEGLAAFLEKRPPSWRIS